MTLLAWIVAGILLPIGALHVVWAFGVPWPFASEAELARAVGGPSLKLHIGWWTKFTIAAVAAGAILASGLLPIMHVGVLVSPVPALVVEWFLAAQSLVFLQRCVLGFADVTPASAHEPFRTLNRRYFSPLIIAPGVICASLLFLASEA